MKVIVSADDFGLSRSITNSILDGVDNGIITNVSILTNGEDTHNALQELLKRKERVSLSLHINLTEGYAVSDPKDVAMLVKQDGSFRFSVIGIWLYYFFLSRGTKKIFSEQIKKEILSQKDIVVGELRNQSTLFSLNGHQHIHMVPCVFRVLMEVSEQIPIRMPDEPFYFSNPLDILRRWRNYSSSLVMYFLGLRHRQMIGRQVLSNGFLGFVYSGEMDEQKTRDGLAYMMTHKPNMNSLEILFHPGIAENNELSEWKCTRADIAWHYSEKRNKEREFLISPQAKKLFNNFTNGEITKKSSI